MTNLPEKDLFSGVKTPRTTTGEMKRALGRLRDFLAELLGEDSSDRERHERQWELIGQFACPFPGC